MIKAVMSIAGSDSSGAAGLQADLRTFQQLGIHGVSVITAATAQTQLGTMGRQTINLDLFQQQLQHLLVDFEVTAIKIGMLANADQARLIARSIPEHIPLIIDPVICSSSGYTLMSPDTLDVMQQRLFPKARLITPNIPELQQLTGTQQPLDNPQRLIKCAEQLVSKYSTSILVKGGHSSNQPLTDYLFEQNNEQHIEITTYQHRRQPGEYRGTGCVLSAAIAAQLAIKSGISLPSACQFGIEYYKAALIIHPAHCQTDPLYCVILVKQLSPSKEPLIYS